MSDVPADTLVDRLRRAAAAAVADAYTPTLTADEITEAADEIERLAAEQAEFVKLSVWTRHHEDWGDETIFKLPDGTEYVGDVWGVR